MGTGLEKIPGFKCLGLAVGWRTGLQGLLCVVPGDGTVLSQYKFYFEIDNFLLTKKGVSVILHMNNGSYVNMIMRKENCYEKDL